MGYQLTYYVPLTLQVKPKPYNMLDRNVLETTSVIVQRCVADIAALPGDMAARGTRKEDMEDSFCEGLP